MTTDIAARSATRPPAGPSRRRLLVALIVIGVAVPAVALGPIIWPPADLGVEPSAAQLGALIALAVGDALFLGAGVAFLIFGYPVIRRVSPDSRLRAWSMYVAIGFVLVSWWPHLNMHASNGLDLAGLLVIDYVFHLPLEIAGVVLAVGVLSLLVERTGRRPAA
ncbi:hypothetical protein [Pseudonocardia sp.]|uniref:hypothetical protein n=1 Tax=Pseudonocardia sp. TaxID=60912 RepID=UPI003D10D997